MSGPASYSVVVLAGGTSRRLGGGDKTALDLGAGRSVLDHLVSSLGRSVPVVVVGPTRPLERSVRWVQESPPGGGPLAGLSAGLAETGEAEWVVLLAGDQPFAGPAVDVLLRASLPPLPDDVEAIVAVDSSGRAQPLLAAYRQSALGRVLSDMGAAVSGGSMHGLLDRLDVVRVAVPPLATLDIDDEQSLLLARETLLGGGSER